MDLSGIVTLMNDVLNGGPHAIIVILLLFIVGLLYDRKRLMSEIQKKDDRLDSIVQDYFEGNITLAHALDSLKSVLYEIKAKF